MKQFLTAIVMGACGALAVFVSFSFHLPSWVLFLAWVNYYLFGKSLKPAIKSLIPITAGILMGVLIQIIGSTLTINLGAIGFPLAVFIFISSLPYLSKSKLLNNIPAWFIGLIIFFGIHPSLEPEPILNLFIPILVGFCFAFINSTAESIILKKSKTANITHWKN